MKPTLPPNVSFPSPERSFTQGSTSAHAGLAQASSSADLPTSASPTHTQPDAQNQQGADSSPARSTSLATRATAELHAEDAAVQSLQQSHPESVPQRRTTLNWLTHFNRDAPTAAHQQDSTPARANLRRTSSNAGLQLNERPTRLQRTEQAHSSSASSQSTSSTSTEEHIDDDSVAPLSAQTVTLDSDLDLDSDFLGSDCDSVQFLRSAFELDGPTQEETSSLAPAANIEIRVNAADPVTAQQNARSMLIEKDVFCRQAAYLLMRKVHGRPLSDEHRELMWRVSKVRTEILKMLPMGRSNVTDDVLACNRNKGDGVGMHSTFRALAARELKFTVPNGSKDEHSYIRAALTAMAGSGSCGDHSLLALHMLGPVMEPGDRAIRQQQTGDDALDHSWVRVECATSGGLSASNPAVILDVWADGPVIDAQDCSFVTAAELKSGELENEPLKNIVDFGGESENGWDKATCQNIHQAFQTFMRDNAANLDKQITAMAQTREKKYLEKNTESKGDPLVDFQHGALSDVVKWSPTAVLHQSILGALDLFQGAALLVLAGGRTTAALSDQNALGEAALSNAALEIARAAPIELQHIDTTELADDIVQMYYNLGRPETRYLLSATPAQLGLLP